MPYVLGVHLGATMTSAAIVRRDGGDWASTATPLPLGRGGPAGPPGLTTPTAVCRTADGSFLAGDAALHQQAAHHEWVSRDFPHRIGEDAPIALGNDFTSPQRLAAAVVEWVADLAAQRQGHPPEHIALAHRATWGPHRVRLVLAELARIGLSDVTAVPEPLAVALDYASKQELSENLSLAVGNAGGSGFDVTVLRRRPGELAFDLVAPPLEAAHPGGWDLDDVVADLVREELDAELPEGTGLPEDTGDPAARAALLGFRESCARAKEALSYHAETRVPVRSPSTTTEVGLSRNRYEWRARPRLERVPEVLHQAVQSSPVPVEELGTVLLAGGTAHTPLLRRLVGDRMGRTPLVDRHPELVAASGAAVAAVRTVAPEAEHRAPPAPRPDPPSDPDVVIPEAAHAEPEPAAEEAAPERPPVAVDPMPLDPPDEARARRIKVLKLSAAAVLIIVGIVLMFVFPPNSPLGGVLGALGSPR
ncbi:hypothetical protein GCM10027174_13340 [Salinifilum aidingensis]